MGESLGEAQNEALRKAQCKALRETPGGRVSTQPRKMTDVYITSTQPNSDSTSKSKPPQSKVSRRPLEFGVVAGHCVFNVGESIWK